MFTFFFLTSNIPSSIFEKSILSRCHGPVHAFLNLMLVMNAHLRGGYRYHQGSLTFQHHDFDILYTKQEHEVKLTLIINSCVFCFIWWDYALPLHINLQNCISMHFVNQTGELFPLLHPVSEHLVILYESNYCLGNSLLSPIITKLTFRITTFAYISYYLYISPIT